MSESKINSKINRVSAARIAESPLGIALLQAFQRLEKDMVSTGGTEVFVQLGFNEPGDEIKPGDLIPTIHFGLRPYEPIMSAPMELVYEAQEDKGDE